MSKLFNSLGIPSSTILLKLIKHLKSYKKYFLTLNTSQKTIVDFETKKGRYYEFLKSDFIDSLLTVDLETQFVWKSDS